jgi:hypothetical protein
MSRSHRLILRLIMGVAAGTFLFAIWSFVEWGRAQSTTNLPPTEEPNEPAASVR